ncbi:MAG TPA: hypothetical protein VNH18_32580 [Bryobacteraceae bacterium]|nr:hypothetical protein [Bryobacteraceae bacterium]
MAEPMSDQDAPAEETLESSEWLSANIRSIPYLTLKQVCEHGIEVGKPCFQCILDGVVKGTITPQIAGSVLAEFNRLKSVGSGC